MKNVSMFVLLASFSWPVSSQIATVTPSALSIANTSIAETKVYSAFSNVAGLGFVNEAAVSAQYENRYAVSALSTKSVSAEIPASWLNTGLAMSYFGYEYYHEILIGAGFAKNFANQFSMGLQFNYYIAYFAATNSYHGAFFPQFGVNVKLSNAFRLGFSAFNPFQTNITTSTSEKRIPSLFGIGGEYAFADDVFVTRFQFEKEISSDYRLAFGVDYRMLHFLKVSAGVYDYDYLVPCLGFGFDLNKLYVQLQVESHPQLGLVSVINLKYRFKH